MYYQVVAFPCYCYYKYHGKEKGTFVIKRTDFIFLASNKGQHRNEKENPYFIILLTII